MIPIDFVELAAKDTKYLICFTCYKGKPAFIIKSVWVVLMTGIRVSKETENILYFKPGISFWRGYFHFAKSLKPI